jgi:hypothetical protein
MKEEEINKLKQKLNQLEDKDTTVIEDNNYNNNNTDEKNNTITDDNEEQMTEHNKQIFSKIYKNLLLFNIIIIYRKE